MAALKAEVLKREFVDSKASQTFPDPNTEFTPEQVRDFLSTQHPHLTNAKVEGPEILTNKLKYKFVVNVGTKG